MVINPILLIGIPLFVAFLIPFLFHFYKRNLFEIVILTLLFNFIASITILNKTVTSPILVILGGWRPPWGINLSVDALGAFLVFIISFVSLMVYLYITYRGLTPQPYEKFNMLYLLVTMGATGMVMTGDIFNMFVFLEITSIASYGLAGIKRDGRGSEGAFKYLVLGSVSSSFVLIGIMFIYGSVGSLNIAHIAQNIDKINPYTLSVAFVMFLLGFGVEAEMFPLNSWVPDTYTGSAHFVTALFSGMVSKAGIYALIRIFYIMFGLSHFSWILITLAVLTLFMAEFSAFTQSDIKRLLAYSSLGQVGMILIGFGIGSYLGYVSGLFQMFNHAISKVLLFLIIGYIGAMIGNRKTKDIEGLGKIMPWSAFIFSIAAFSIMGLPPFAGFWGKFYLIFALIQAKPVYMIVAIAVLLITLVEAYYYLRIVNKMYFASRKKENVHAKDPGWKTLSVMLILVIVIILVGVYPKFILTYIKPAANALLNRGDYINFVLKGGL